MTDYEVSKMSGVRLQHYQIGKQEDILQKWIRFKKLLLCLMYQLSTSLSNNYIVTQDVSHKTDSSITESITREREGGGMR